MTTKRRTKGSVPRALAIVPTDAPPPTDDAPVEMVATTVILVFQVDGEPAFNARFQAQVPRLPEDQNAMQFTIALDGRLLAQMLAPHVGPTPADNDPGKLWTPGTPHH